MKNTIFWVSTLHKILCLYLKSKIFKNMYLFTVNSQLYGYRNVGINHYIIYCMFEFYKHANVLLLLTRRGILWEQNKYASDPI
jgi:hypothetical protein